MPKIVDHDERRRQLAQATLRVIGRSGLGSATTRAVAEESGWSTGVLKHYYADKSALLEGSLARARTTQPGTIRDRRSPADGPRGDPRGVSAILRGDPSETRSWIAFTARASVDPHTAPADAPRHRGVGHTVGRPVRRGQGDGSIRAELDADRVAIDLHALVNGLRIRELFRPARPTRRRPILDDRLMLIEGLGPD